MKVDLDSPNKKITKKAKAILSGKENKISGTATFTEYQVDDFYYVRLELDLEGPSDLLTPGKHAVHIHEKGDCGDEFKCAGGHFDPGPASNPDPDVNHPFHAGDLPNITIDENGKGHLEAITTRVTLSSGSRSIIDVEGGTSLMVHANTDPYDGGEHGSGISGGPRIACGIIKSSN